MDQPTTTTEAAPPTAEAEQQVEQQVTPEETAEQKAPLISDEARHAIASGFLAQVLPMLDRLTKQIVELQAGQREMILSMSSLDALGDVSELDVVFETLARAPLYLQRMKELKLEMQSLAEKSARNSRRAIKLQRKRQEDEYQEGRERLKFEEQDKLIAAKVVQRP